MAAKANDYNMNMYVCFKHTAYLAVVIADVKRQLE